MGGRPSACTRELRAATISLARLGATGSEGRGARSSGADLCSVTEGFEDGGSQNGEALIDDDRRIAGHRFVGRSRAMSRVQRSGRKVTSTAPAAHRPAGMFGALSHRHQRRSTGPCRAVGRKIRVSGSASHSFQ